FSDEARHAPLALRRPRSFGEPRVISRFCCSPKLRGRLSAKGACRASSENPRACMTEYNESFCHAWQHRQDNLSMKFELHSNYQPRGDQPAAIDQLSSGVASGDKHQVLL